MSEIQTPTIDEVQDTQTQPLTIEQMGADHKPVDGCIEICFFGKVCKGDPQSMFFKGQLLNAVLEATDGVLTPEVGAMLDKYNNNEITIKDFEDYVYSSKKPPETGPSPEPPKSEIQQKLENKFNLSPEELAAAELKKNAEIEAASAGTERLGNTGAFRIEETTPGKIDLIQLSTGQGLLARFEESTGEGDMSKSAYESFIQQLIDNHYVILEAENDKGEVIARTFFEHSSSDNLVYSWMVKIPREQSRETTANEEVPTELEQNTVQKIEDSLDLESLRVTHIDFNKLPIRAATTEAHETTTEDQDIYKEEDVTLPKTKAQTTLEAEDVTLNEDIPTTDSSKPEFIETSEYEAPRTPLTTNTLQAAGEQTSVPSLENQYDFSPQETTTPNLPRESSLEVNVVTTDNEQTDDVTPLSNNVTAPRTQSSEITRESASQERSELVTTHQEKQTQEPAVQQRESHVTVSENQFFVTTDSGIIESLFEIHGVTIETDQTGVNLTPKTETQTYEQKNILIDSKPEQTTEDYTEEVTEQTIPSEALVNTPDVEDIPETKQSNTETTGISIVQTQEKTQSPKTIQQYIPTETRTEYNVSIPDNAPVLKIDQETGSTVIDSLTGITLVISQKQQTAVERSLFNTQFSTVNEVAPTNPGNPSAPETSQETPQAISLPTNQYSTKETLVSSPRPETIKTITTEKVVTPGSADPLPGLNTPIKETSSFLRTAQEEGVGKAVITESLDLLQKALQALTELGKKPERSVSHEQRLSSRKYRPSYSPILEQQNNRRPLGPKGATVNRKEIKLAA